LNQARIKNFWDWFRARADKIREDPGRHADEIHDMLERLQPGLAWEMGGKNDDWEFIVRTEDPAFRYATHQIVSAAPGLAHWRVSAWRQAEAYRDLRIRVGQGKEFDLKKFSFEIEADPRYPILNLTVVSSQYGTKIASDESYAGYLALDGLLGEKQVEDAFDSIEFRNGVAGPIAAPALAEEVRRRRADLRARPIPAPDDKWATMEGKKDDLPWIALVATGLDLSLLPSHPWRVDVSLPIQAPVKNGMPSSEELNAMRMVEDKMVEVVEAGNRGFVWTHRTHNGRRTTSFYVQDPVLVEESFRAALDSSEYQGELEISYDPRWRVWRMFADQG
jgi:hypothetical protein